PYAHLKENAWQEAEAIDAALQRGEIGEDEWHRRWHALLVPAYLAAQTPGGQSGKTGTAEDWEWSRSHVVDAIDRDGSFLDVGCANGYLMECLPRWTPFCVEPYGLEISPELAELARTRLPNWADRIFVGNALGWEAPREFDVVRTGLGYVPPRRRPELVERLLGYGRRLVVGVFNEHESEHTTEDALESWGFTIGGRSVRPNRRRPGMEYRVLWIDG
ncbi:MAG TPA: class I SAM-dependent methyltransferase, partial [Gaiellaceae bacterium]|nr:class I SAM-dependent methyltransferase [Gaiellaceae bacterium]